MLPLLDIKGLRVVAGPESRAVVDGVNLQVAPGTTLGLVGESGSGKSLTAKAVLGLLPFGCRIVDGSIRVDGSELVSLGSKQMNAFRGKTIGLIPQNAVTSLNPLMSVGRQIGAVLRNQGLSRHATKLRTAELLAELRLPEPAAMSKRYPHELSGGTAQRVVAAAALAANPKLLIADEPTSSIDPVAQVQFLNLLGSIQTRRALGIVLITHDIGIVARACDEVVVMYAGRVMESGSVQNVLGRSQHPYTRALLESAPTGANANVPLVPIPGQPMSGGIIGNACPFAARCGAVFDRCRIEAPPLLIVSPGHMSSCWLVDNRTTEIKRAQASAELA
jgi:oligopeptide/dipeptide ABC transporter ATP-binding protein